MSDIFDTLDTPKQDIFDTISSEKEDVFDKISNVPNWVQRLQAEKPQNNLDLVSAGIDPSTAEFLNQPQENTLQKWQREQPLKGQPDKFLDTLARTAKEVSKPVPEWFNKRRQEYQQLGEEHPILKLPADLLGGISAAGEIGTSALPATLNDWRELIGTGSMINNVAKQTLSKEALNPQGKLAKYIEEHPERETANYPFKGMLFKTPETPEILRGQLKELPKAEGFNLGIVPEGVQKGEQLVKDVSDYMAKSKEQVKYSGNILDDFYKLKNKNAIDNINTREIITNAKGKPSDYESIYHWIENPKESITLEQKALYDTEIAPIRAERERLYAKLVNEGVPVEHEGYTPRNVLNKGGFFDRSKGGVATGGMFSKTTPELKKRMLKAIEDEAGNRYIVDIKKGKVTNWENKKSTDLGSFNLKTNDELLTEETKHIDSKMNSLQKELDILTGTKGREKVSPKRIENIQKEILDLTNQRGKIEAKYNPNELDRKLFIDKNGKKWNVTDATTKEIEANTNLKYQKNVLGNEILAYNNLKKVDRNIEYLENLKTDPEFNKIAIKLGTQNIPSDYKTTDLLQLKGYAFPKRIAETFDGMYKKAATGVLAPDNAYSSINSFLRNAIFFNPLIHIPNVTVHGIVNRGIAAYAIPSRYATLVKTSGKAIKSVLSMDENYKEMLEKGASLMYSETVNRDLHKVMLNKMASELEQNPELLGKVGKAIGYVNPINLIKGIYKFSGKATWAVNDITMMQAIYEEMAAHRKTMETAIKDVGKHLPTYRIPPRVLNSTTISKLMQPDSGVTMFGAYHYGALKSYGEMAKSLVTKVPMSERAEALDKIAMLALTTYFIYPQLDNLAKFVTGNEKANVRRAGASTFPYKTQQLAQGEIGFSDWLQSIMTPSVGFQLGTELMSGRNWRTGKRIASYPETIARSIAPIGQGERIASGQLKVGDFVASLGGINFSGTSADRLMARYNADKSGGSEPTSEQQDKFSNIKNFRESLQGKDKNINFDQLSPKNISTVASSSWKKDSQRQFERLTSEEAMEVYQKGEPEEKKLWSAQLYKKYGSALQNSSPKERKKLVEKFNKIMQR